MRTRWRKSEPEERARDAGASFRRFADSHVWAVRLSCSYAGIVDTRSMSRVVHQSFNALASILAAFVAFVAEHQRCGDLDGGVDDGRVWMACDCGGGIAHPVKPPKLDQPGEQR
jgi:hypothetical protein